MYSSLGYSRFTGWFATLLVTLMTSPLLLAADRSAEEVAEDVVSAADERLAELVAEIREDYPGVRHISLAELKQDFPHALLVDVREREEFEVSRLPGAMHAPEASDIDALRRQFPDRPFVLYCTVGVRSAIAAQALNARGAGDAPPAVNFAGSIFAWANGGEPLVNDEGATQEVHPYSAWWGMRYLEESASE